MKVHAKIETEKNWKTLFKQETFMSLEKDSLQMYVLKDIMKVHAKLTC